MFLLDSLHCTIKKKGQVTLAASAYPSLQVHLSWYMLHVGNLLPQGMTASLLQRPEPDSQAQLMLFTAQECCRGKF